MGIAPKIFDSSEAFPNLFSDRWGGDLPLEGAYFYFDAINLLTVAFSQLDDVDEFSYEELTGSIVQASSTRGIASSWDNLDDRLEKAEDGLDIHYSGLTGPILLQSCGNRRSGSAQAWTIADESIEVLE